MAAPSSPDAGRRRGLPVLLAGLALAGCAPGPTWEGTVNDHFDGKRFHNYERVERKPFDFWKWRLTADLGPWEVREDVRRATPPERMTGDRVRITFVNHATVLIQAGGLNVLTDPIWSERTSPISWAGPKRHRPPGVAFEALPPIDVVLVSHNHYDHMDMSSLRRLQAEHDPLFLVPLNNAHYLAGQGIARLVEMDWWESRDLAGPIRVHAVPAQHWSRRTLLDTNKALWAGYWLETPAGALYFAGDTGMARIFEMIRRRLGAPRVAMLPIGAFLPQWFMSPVHLSPAEALRASRTLDAGLTMAIHFGTFPLGDDGMDEPVRELEQAITDQGVDRERVWIPANGDTRQLAPAAGPGS